VTGALRRRLARTPRLLAAYLAWHNVSRGAVPRWAAAVLIGWTAWVILVPSALIDWLRHATVVLAVVAAVVASTLVSRRRASNRDETRRSWTAALPVEPGAARLQAFVIGTVPAWRLAAVVALPCIGSRGLWLPGAAMIGGLAAGVVVGLLIPPALPESLPEGSRYVPHRRRVGQPLPRGSLAALGAWPVRQMFASARPKTVARATVPVLLLVPMGSRADAVLVVLGLVAVIGALGLLLHALSSAGHSALRWLQPLPVRPGGLLWRIAGRAGWVIVLGAALEAWLPSLLGATARCCLQMGAVTLTIGVLGALTAAWVGRLRALRDSR